MTSDHGWRLDRFEEQLDLWAERESVDPDLVLMVLAWVLGRMDDPYDGMERAPGFEDLWHGPLPGTLDPRSGRVVTCSYWIDRPSRTVRLDNFGLQRP